MKLSLKLAAGLLALFFALKGLKLEDLVAAVSLVSLKTVLYCAILCFVAWAISGLKWLILLPQPGFLRLISLVFVGQFYSTVMPGQIVGELVKAYRLGKGRRDAEHIAASVLVDKITGLLGLLAVASVGLMASRALILPEISLAIGLCTLSFCVGLFCLRIPFVYLLIATPLNKAVDRWPHLDQHVSRIFRLLDAWRGYLDQRFRLLCAFLLGAVFQLLCVWIILLLSRELGINLAFPDWCWIFGLVSVAVLLPVSIAGIGVREGTFVAALSLQGIPVEKSVALSLAVFTISLAGAIIGGFLELFQGVSLWPFSISQEPWLADSGRRKTQTLWLLIILASLCLIIAIVGVMGMPITYDTEINTPEFLFFLLAFSILAYYVAVHLGSWRQSIIPLILGAFPLYLAIVSCSQFLTVDEIGLIFESIHLRSWELPAWLSLAQKTTDILMTPLVLLELILSHAGVVISETELKMIWKLVHWLYAFGCLLWIHYILSSYFVAAQQRTTFLVLFLVSTLLLPTNVLAFKVFNYDKLSMLLGVIASLYLVIAWQQARAALAALAIVISCLAAQEKLVASPILLAAIVSYACLSDGTKNISPIRLLLGVLRGFLICLAIGVASVGVLYIIRSGNVPGSVWTGIMSPVTTWLSPIGMFVMGLSGQETFSVKFQMLALPISFLACMSAALVSRFAIVSLGSMPRMGVNLTAGLPKLVLFLLAVSVITGVISTGLVPGYYHPFAPIVTGGYIPSGVFNGVILHYGAHSFAEHVSKSVSFAYAVLVSGVPTGLWLLALIGFVHFETPTKSANTQTVAAYILLLFAALLPLAFGLFQVPVGNKYLNISFMLLAIGFCLLATLELSIRKFYVRATIIGIIYIGIIAEVYPFGPLYLAFRPFWSNYPDATQPVPGKFSPSMSGWGEELMLASRLFDDDASLGQGCAKIKMYFNYPGEWLSLSSKRERFTVISFNDLKARSFTPCDYYLFSRHGAIHGREYLIGFPQFPAPLVPDARISFRGYDTAWLYRGDRLIENPLVGIKIYKSRSCIGVIDTINGTSPTTGPLTATTLLEVTGWLAESIEPARVPEAIYLVLTDGNGSSQYFRTSKIRRPDVGVHFNKSILEDTGFGTLADISKLQGKHLLGLAVKEGGRVEQCPQFSVPVSIANEISTGEM